MHSKVTTWYIHQDEAGISRYISTAYLAVLSKERYGIVEFVFFLVCRCTGGGGVAESYDNSAINTTRMIEAVVKLELIKWNAPMPATRRRGCSPDKEHISPPDTIVAISTLREGLR